MYQNQSSTIDDSEIISRSQGGEVGGKVKLLVEDIDGS